MKELNKYIGRNVRLRQQTFQEVAQRGRRQGNLLDNCFVVAAVSPQLRKLICYGANGRIAVGLSEVAMI